MELKQKKIAYYDFRKFVVLRIFINSWNGLAIFNRMNKAQLSAARLHIEPGFAHMRSIVRAYGLI